MASAHPLALWLDGQPDNLLRLDFHFRRMRVVLP